MSQNLIIQALRAAPETISPVLMLEMGLMRMPTIDKLDDLLLEMLDDEQTAIRSCHALQYAPPEASPKVPVGF